MQSWSQTYQPYGERYDQGLEYKRLQAPGDAVYILQQANALAGTIPVGAEFDDPQSLQNAVKTLERFRDEIDPAVENHTGADLNSLVVLSNKIPDGVGTRIDAAVAQGGTGENILGFDKNTHMFLVHPVYFDRVKKAVPTATGSQVLETFKDIAFPDQEIIAFSLGELKSRIDGFIAAGKARAGHASGRAPKFFLALGGVMLAGAAVCYAVGKHQRKSGLRGGTRVCIRRPASRKIRFATGFLGGAVVGGAVEFTRRKLRGGEARTDQDMVGYALAAGVGGLIGGAAHALPGGEIPCPR